MLRASQLNPAVSVTRHLLHCLLSPSHLRKGLTEQGCWERPEQAVQGAHALSQSPQQSPSQQAASSRLQLGQNQLREQGSMMKLWAAGS